MVFIAIGSGFHQTDSLVLWGPKAFGIISEGLGGVVTRGTNATTYPLHIPILLAMLMDAFGNSLPIAKVVFPLFYLSTLLIGYEFSKSRIERVYAGLSMAIFATLPVVAGHQSSKSPSQNWICKPAINILPTWRSDPSYCHLYSGASKQTSSCPCHGWIVPGIGNLDPA